MLNRQQSAARHRPAMAPPPIQTVGQPLRANVMGETMNSPLVQPTPPSQRDSPSATRSPAFPTQVTGPSTTDLQPRQQFAQQRSMQPMPQTAFQPQQPQQQQQQQRAHHRSMSGHTMSQPYSRRGMHVPVSQVQANYYPTSFQKHYDQLGKSTPIHPFQFLLGSSVRPRLNPLVQTRSMTLKLTCLTTLTATTWIQIASFPISGCRHRQEVAAEWQCKRLHQRLLPRQAMQGDKYHPSPSIMILCLMLTHLGCLRRCIFRTLLEDCRRREGDVVLSIPVYLCGLSFVRSFLICVCQKVFEHVSAGVMAGLNVQQSWRLRLVRIREMVLKALIYCEWIFQGARNGSGNQSPSSLSPPYFSCRYSFALIISSRPLPRRTGVTVTRSLLAVCT